MTWSASEVSAQLLQAATECDEFIQQVQNYDWSYGPYPLGLDLPFPMEDIKFFHEQAHKAADLKTRILTLLERLGPSADQWMGQITNIAFFEEYIEDPLVPGAKRPRVSGLTAAREVLKTANVSIKRLTRMPKSVTSREAVKACQAYKLDKDLNTNELANQFGTTDRTLRNFFKTGTIKTSIFHDIARAMGLTPEQLKRGEWPADES